MTQTQVNLRDLVSVERRHKEYTLQDYIGYCKQIRTAIMSLPEEFDDRQMINFFEKDFVEEMEVLARICKHQFHGDDSGIKVQYMREDPPDGTITLASGKKIHVECTSAVDRRWENFVLEQWRKHGKLFSLSGFDGKDVQGNRKAGYSVNGMDINDPQMEEYSVEAEEDCDTMSKHRRHIVDKIEKKLHKAWEDRTNWLCVVVNEFMMPGGSYACMEPVLNEIVMEYSDRLRESHIAAVYFVSNNSEDRGWMSFHPTAAH